ncbi:hypothetical protein LTR56_019206 [Elasticomyces elasticus]|nr:hypothetical protein LTR56_019206 [Elasticomyces elasticus]KAK3633214.1 hypothetical protein LTR22_020214 [Elasticomyces elasticus]KAK4910627.1 hypothetical protein LTR49_020759 [Elasticomyces elasticus]KAK5751038.1 hypothetical protein LTS12_018939 [Elasticomyces elasticus]
MAPASKRRRKPKSMADDVPNLPKSFVIAGEVLNLPELLEMILLNLPMRNMQRVRRVSKQWQATVDNSLPIKRALFQEPGTIADLAYDARCRDARTKRIHRRCLKYSCHPHFPAHGSDPGKHLNVLTKRAYRIPRVFLTQPPETSASIVVALHTSTRKCATIRLEANETFGSLNEQIVQTLERRSWDASEIVWSWIRFVDDSEEEEDH